MEPKFEEKDVVRRADIESKFGVILSVKKHGRGYRYSVGYCYDTRIEMADSLTLVCRAENREDRSSAK